MAVPTYNDWTNRLDRLQDQVHQLGTMVVSFKKHTRASSDLVDTVNRLEYEKGNMENKKQDAEEAAAAYDREFIERKDSQADPFRPSKIYTIQDFTTFFLFVSYCIFVLAMTLTFENKLQIIGIAVVVAMIALIWLFRYA